MLVCVCNITRIYGGYGPMGLWVYKPALDWIALPGDRIHPVDGDMFINP